MNSETSVLRKQMTLKGLEKIATEEKIIEEHKKKRGNFLLRQELQDYTPNWDLITACKFIFILAIVFILLGLWMIFNTNDHKEFKVEYSSCNQRFCLLDFNITETLEQPLFFYYSLDNFFSNHRLYVRSRSYTQMEGKSFNNDGYSFCDGANYNFEVLYNDTKKYISIDGSSLEPEGLSLPCGLVSMSIFNGK